MVTTGQSPKNDMKSQHFVLRATCDFGESPCLRDVTPNKFNSKGRMRSRQNKTQGAFRFRNAGDFIVKRLTLAAQTLATGAGTVIPITTVSSQTVFTAPAIEFASFAARYQQYRIRAIRVTGKSTQPVQTATISHSNLYRGDTLGGATPGTSAQVFSDENVKECATHRDFVDLVTWSRNPNAKLWNPTSAAIPAANEFAWECASASSPSLTTATTYYAFTVEWEVEFRSSQ